MDSKFRQLSTPEQRIKKCQVCGKSCADDTSLDSHYSLLHPEMKLICLKCPNITSFSSMSTLRHHSALKHASKASAAPPPTTNFGCTLCNYVSSTKEKLGEHIRAAHSFYCRYKHCSFKGTSKEALVKHASSTHEFRCSAVNCLFAAESREKLDAHVNAAHTHRCEFCSFRSPQENVLRIHVRKMHVEKIKCAQCPMLVPKSEMDSHKKMKHGPESHVRTTRSQQNLDDKGGARKLYPCPECKVNFSSLDIMREHVKTRHKKQLEVVYKCPKSLCTYQTSNRIEMQKHQKEQHSAARSIGTAQIAQARPAAKPKPTSFDCQFCDFSAKSMEVLREHRSIHLQKPEEPEEDVPLDMEVTSEDVPPPILAVDSKNMEVASEDAHPSTAMVDSKSMEVAGKNAQPSSTAVDLKDLEVASKNDGPSTAAVDSKSMEVAGKNAQPSSTAVDSKDLEVASEDGRPSSAAVDSQNMEVTSGDACLSTAAVNSKNVEVATASEEVPRSTAAVDSKNMDVASKGPQLPTPAVDLQNMEVACKDVSAPTAAVDSKKMEVTSKPPIGEVDSINMEVTNEDVPPPIGEVDSQED